MKNASCHPAFVNSIREVLCAFPGVSLDFLHEQNISRTLKRKKWPPECEFSGDEEGWKNIYRTLNMRTDAHFSAVSGIYWGLLSKWNFSHTRGSKKGTHTFSDVTEGVYLIWHISHTLKISMDAHLCAVSGVYWGLLSQLNFFRTWKRNKGAHPCEFSDVTEGV